MAHRISWSSRAVADLEAIASYISVDSPAYAHTVVRRIISLTRTLQEFPHAGRMVPEFDDESIREVVAYSYRIIYKVETERILIAAVLHGSRQL